MRIRRRVPADPINVTRDKPPVNTSDAVFVFACIAFSVMALYLLFLGLYVDKVIR